MQLKWPSKSGGVQWRQNVLYHRSRGRVALSVLSSAVISRLSDAPRGLSAEPAYLSRARKRLIGPAACCRHDRDMSTLCYTSLHVQYLNNSITKGTTHKLCPGFVFKSLFCSSTVNRSLNKLHLETEEYSLGKFFSSDEKQLEWGRNWGQIIHHWLTS